MSPAERVCMLAGRLDEALAEHKVAAAELERAMEAEPLNFAVLAAAAKRVNHATGGMCAFANLLAEDTAPRT